MNTSDNINNVYLTLFSRPLEELLLKEHKQRHKSKKRLNKKLKKDSALRLLAREANYAKTVLVTIKTNQNQARLAAFWNVR